MSDTQLGNEVLDLGKAIGLFNDGGSLQTHWFNDPLQNIESIFTVDTQRAAFLRVLDALLAPVQLPDTPAGETWHPLLGDQTLGNAYLTVNTTNAVTFGFAGEFHSTDGPPPLASLRAHLPLVSFNGGNVTAVAGSASGPLDLSLRIHLGFTFGTDPIGLDSVVVTASLAPLGGSPPATLTVDLEGLQLDDSGPKNVTLDPSNLGSEATHLIIGFIREQFHRLAGPTGEAGGRGRQPSPIARIRQHHDSAISVHPTCRPRGHQQLVRITAAGRRHGPCRRMARPSRRSHRVHQHRHGHRHGGRSVGRANPAVWLGCGIGPQHHLRHQDGLLHHVTPDRYAGAGHSRRNYPARAH